MTTHTTGSIAQRLGAELIGPGDLVIERVDALDEAGQRSVTFIRASSFADKWASSRAAAALVTKDVDVQGHDPSSRALLVVPDADLAMIELLTLFAPESEPVTPGVHASAIVHESARVDPSVAIGPGCVVGARASLAKGVVLHANVTIGADVSIGEGTVLRSNVVVEDRCVIGRACIVHANATIGADGFGYHPSPDGTGVVKIPHIGNVEIGDAVEIGAGTCIDRGKFGATSIGSGTKIDNLVQIGHNCKIGRACIVCGSVGIAGSATLGDGVMIGGGCGVGDNLTIGAGAKLAASSHAMNDIPPGETWGGTPAIPARTAMINHAEFRKLAETLKSLRRTQKALEQRLEQIEAETRQPSP